MLKKLINQAELTLRIEPIDPLLIKSGQATVGGTDMSFVRTYRQGKIDPDPYLPGSSLKGVLRSYCEKICRTLRAEPVPVCLPYLKKSSKPEEENQLSCGLILSNWKSQKPEREISSWDAYRVSCPTCRLFGSLQFTGRCSFSDGYAVEPCLLEKRDCVAIDRITGGAAPNAKYDLEVLTKGVFEASISLTNFEHWQLGLLGLALRDMQDGLISLGSGKSRGLGRFRGHVNQFTVSYFHQKPEILAGLGSLCSDKERQQYDLAAETTDNGQRPLPEPSQKGLRNVYDISQNWLEFMEPCVQDLVGYIQEVAWPDQLNQFVRGDRQ